MDLKGNFRQIGHDAINEIYSSLKNDSKIDISELENIKKSLMSDGNKTKGEIDLFNKIEDCLNKKLDIKVSDFEPKSKSMNFDLKITNKYISITNSKKENFKDKIQVSKICDFLDKNFDKLTNKYKQIDMSSLEKSLRSPKFPLNDKKIIDRVIQNIDIFDSFKNSNFMDLKLDRIPNIHITKEDINRIKQLSKNLTSNPEKVKNQLNILENNTFRSEEHLNIIDKASKTNISSGSKEWGIIDFANYGIRSSVPGIDKSYGEDWINEFKDKYIKSHKNVIKEASKMYDVPEKLLAGVLSKEVGGWPYITDTVSYLGKKYLPEEIKGITKKLSGDKQLTSFGNVSIQIRRVKESLGYSHEISSKQEKEIINSLQNPKEAIFICAKHLKDLKNIDFKNKPFNKLSNYELAIVATRYNVGPGDTKERQSGKGFNYGQSIVDNFKNISKLLE